jgi:peptidoglycan/xylan/chitin deacetylase (PgdA/CDA1 family)
MRNPIFMYHGTSASAAPALERQLRVLAQWCEIVPLAEIVADPERRGRWPRRRAALTFDDGLRSNVSVTYPILQRLSMPAMFFVCPGLIERGEWLWTHEMRRRLLGLSPQALRELALGLGSPTTLDGVIDWMKRLPIAARQSAEREIRAATTHFRPSAAEREAFDLASWEELKRLDPRLVTLGSHTLTHPILSSLDAEQNEREIRDSREAIERETGRTADIFCYPNGDFGQAALDTVRRYYRAAVTESERALPHWDAHRIPRVSEERSGLRGWLGLARKTWFPYSARAPLSAASVALVTPAMSVAPEDMLKKGRLREAA